MANNNRTNPYNSSNYPYNENYVAPYKNNTLAWVAWNAKSFLEGSIGADVQQIKNEWQDAKDYLVPEIKDIGNDILKSEKNIFIDAPINALNTAANFITGGAEANSPEWQRMPTTSRPAIQPRQWQSVANAQNTSNEYGNVSGQTTWQPTMWQPLYAPQTNQGWQPNQAQTNQWVNNTQQTPTFSSKEDVVYYLAQQPWWNSLTEQERVDRVEALWQQSQGNQEIEWETLGNEVNSEDYSDSIVQRMENRFDNNTGWTIYWKTTADGWNPRWWIDAREDANSPFKMAEEARITKVQSMLSEDPSEVAFSLAWWDNAFSEQTLTDVKRFAPEYWAEVQKKLKEIKVADTVNAIASWSDYPDNGKNEIASVNNWVNTWAESVSSTPQQTAYTIWNTTLAMSNNQVATSATQLIAGIDAQIEEYKSKINNLVTEANSVFKWDTPDYIVNAYINNRMQQYQSEIEKLEWRRQSALDIYKIELSNYQWGVEMDLKYKQFNQDVNNDLWNRYYKEKQLNMDSVKVIDWKAYLMNWDWTMVQVSDETARASYNQGVNETIQWYLNIFTAWWGTRTGTGYKYNVSGWQCQAFTNNFTEMTTWLRMDRWNTAADKYSYVNTFTPVVWSVAVAFWWVYDSYYWHTMLVTWYDPSTWMVDLLWSNNNWDELVYTTHDSLQNLYNKWLKWFWDPYQDMIKAWMTTSWWYNPYWFELNPMTPTFDRLIELWKANDEVAAAERMYSSLYKIANDGSLDALINSWDIAKIISYMTKWKFWEVGDDRWYAFRNRLSQYIQKKAAKELSSDASLSALNELLTLVEIKLREESWAAVNSSEWLTNFEMFLPMAWESSDYQYNKLKLWDGIIYQNLRNGWLKSSEYIPVFSSSVVKEIW